MTGALNLIFWWGSQLLKVRQYRDLEHGESIVVGVDPGTGERNYSCAQFLSRTMLDVPLVYHTSEIAVVMTNEIVPMLEKIYGQTGIRPVIAYERGNGGVFELERLSAMNRRGKFEIYKMANNKVGWDTNTATRPKMLGDLKDAIDKHLITLYDKITVEEMFSFILSRSASLWKARAERGAVDDAIMALAIAWQLHIGLPYQSGGSLAAEENRQFQSRRSQSRA